MTVYVYDHDTGKVVPKGARQADRGPGKLVADEMDAPVQSMADGKFYTSRSMLRASYRASGNPQGVEYLEVGNDPARLRPEPRKRPDPRGAHEAVQKAYSRYVNGERI